MISPERQDTRPWTAASTIGPNGPMADRSTIIEQHRQRVLEDLTSASGDASLCSISKSAGPVPGIKYLEGRMAAVMEIRRSTSRGADAVSAVADAHTTWSRRLHDAERNAMSRDWTAYYAGGVDQLAELAAELAT